MNNTKKGDSGAKLIFGNEELVSQLLRNYSGLEILKDVQAEDIEDVTDRYVPMFEEERDSDVVKKIHLKGNEKPFFLISLIEHKSRVDYNVIMQLLRYMVFIWIDYEDSGRWTADMNLAERIMLNEGETICVIKQVCKKLDKAKTMEQMADELEENMETIAKICSAIEKVGVHDAEAIFRIINPE